MVNPGTFKGLQKDFLMSEKSTYAAGVQEGYSGDTLIGIQCCYFKRFPIDLPHDEEPSADYLSSVDNNAADTDLE
ncbi:hypothetical protein BYT27DRAFT_7060880, partial [Phlegmacium glaucopus]